MTADILAFSAEEDVYLKAYLEPLAPWLDAPDVTEILVNRPGELWVERAGQPMAAISLPAITDALMQRLAEQTARISHQGINREQPLLSAVLNDGSRIQFVGPSATRGHWALAVRRHRVVDVPLESYARILAGRPDRSFETEHSQNPTDCLRAAVRARKTILISGGTSTGKTTFLNTLLREVPPEERVILVEDTPEVRLPGPNGLGLVAVKGEMGEARVTTDDLLQAALRLRPDRIVLGELRGREAVSFLRAINTGHPGSFTTIHANSPDGALEQLALMVMQAGLGLSRTDTIAYANMVVDVIVQLDRVDGVRGISALKMIRKD